MAATPGILKLLLDRHTIRNYDPTYAIPKEQIEQIFEAVRHSPTAFTCQDVDFMICLNRETNQKAADAQLAQFPDQMRDGLLERKEKFKVSNVITCDASAEVIIYKNERAQNENYSRIHAGIAAMAICVAAKEFGLDTMCHIVMVGNGAEEVYGIPKDSALMAVAIGKALPDAHVSARGFQNKITILE